MITLTVLAVVLVGVALQFSRSHGFRSANYSFSAYKDYNLLLITIDTLRADHLPVYGYTKVNTPNLDQLAQGSLIFERAIAHAPLTLPSHTSIMTGLLPIAHGVRNNGGYFLDPKIITLAEILKSKGYATAAFVSAFALDSYWQLDHGFDLYFDNFNQFEDISSRQIQRPAGETEVEVEHWLPGIRNKRFFCWVHFYDPHDPYTPPEPYKTEYSNFPYDGEIAYTDEVIGKLFAKLEELHLKDRTLIVVTGDHGESLGQHQELTHGLFIYDATLHVPLLIHLPGDRQQRRIQGIARHIDIAPTLLQWMGIQPPVKMQGRSLIPLIQGKEKQKRIAYSESIYAKNAYGWSPLKGITTEEYKFIDAPKSELYDEKSDPRETRNLIEEKPSIAKALRSQLDEIIDSQSSESAKGPQKMDPETEEKLRALGYIGATTEGTAEGAKIDPKDKIQLVINSNLAFTALVENQNKRALELLNPVLQEEPDMVEALYGRGAAYYHLQEYDKAIKDLLKTLSIRPDHTGALYTLGCVYETTDDLKQAEYYFKKVLQYEENHRYAKMKLGLVYRLLNEPGKAKPLFDQLIDFYTKALETTTGDKTRSLLLSALADIYVTAGNLAEAEKNLKAAIALDPRTPGLHFDLAEVYDARNELLNAVAEYEKETELEPYNFDAYTNLGLVYYKLQRFDKAAMCFQKVLEIQPRNPRASLLLAETYVVSQGNLEDALQLAKSALEQRPDYKKGYILLSTIYAKLGRQKEAVQAKRQAGLDPGTN